MPVTSIVQLVCLAAIWGGSFIFMRVLAPALGPVATADLRILIAGLALTLYFSVIRLKLEWRKHWKSYLLIGVVNSAIPFFLYSFAALHLPASYEVILNSSSPLFGALFSALWLGERIDRVKALGLATGASGVALVTQVGVVQVDARFTLSVAACLAAAACYGLSGVYIKKFVKGAKPMAIAGCSQLLAGALFLPALPLGPRIGALSLSIVANILGLALLCSAVAYLLYYRLIADVGPTKALTVTFLMPAFGMLWGALFLGEVITAPMILGVLVIVAGTSLVLRARPAPTRPRPLAPALE